MKYPRSSTVRKWVATCMVAKSAKAGIRGTKLVGAAIPIGALGMATNVITNLGRAGVRMNYWNVVNRVAMELYWRANVEMWLSGVGGGKITTKVNGPASAIMCEIFRRRGPTGFLVNVMSLTLFRNPVVGSLCALSYFDVIIQQFLQERSQRSIANQAYHMERATSGWTRFWQLVRTRTT